MTRNALGWAVFVVLAIGCGGAGPHVVVEPRKVDAADGKPKIAKVTDLGDMGAVPANGFELPTFDSDGVYVVGERVLVEGANFGKQPTVNIGGRPAAVIARTGNGGIVTRIPPGVPTGDGEVEISHTSGSGAKKISITRYALVVPPGGDGVRVISLAGDGKVKLQGTIDIAGARDIAISSDGAGAYVAADGGGKARLGVIGLHTSGGPRLLREIALGGTTASRVVTATDAPIGAVLGGTLVTAFDLTDSRNPAVFTTTTVDDLTSSWRSIAMQPKGGSIVALIGEGNQLLPIDLTRPSAPRAGQPIDLMPDERVSLVRDLGFSPSGAELWIVAGDDRESLVAGVHPASLIICDRNGTRYKVRRTVSVTGAEAPVALAVARHESIIGGTAIRSTSRKAAIVVAGVDRALLRQLGQGSPAAALVQPISFGQLVRTDLEGKGEAIWAAEARVSDVALSQDGRWLVSATTRVKRAGAKVTLDFGVMVTPIAGGESTFLHLGGLSGAGDLMKPGSVAIAP